MYLVHCSLACFVSCLAGFGPLERYVLRSFPAIPESFLLVVVLGCLGGVLWSLMWSWLVDLYYLEPRLGSPQFSVNYPMGDFQLVALGARDASLFSSEERSFKLRAGPGA